MVQPPDRFEFRGRHFDPSTGELALDYGLGEWTLTERFFFPAIQTLDASRQAALDHALDALHWIAGVSYFKTFCPAQWLATERAPTPDQGAWLDQIYRQGLAEFAYRNQLDPTSFPPAPRSSIAGVGVDSDQAPTLGLKARALLPLGGGKDSIVAWHRLSQKVAKDHIMTVQVGEAPLIQALGQWMFERGDVAQHWVIGRQLDPQLTTLNAHGAMNGHVPMTAINSAVMAVLAVLVDARWVVFANERSADEPTLWTHEGEPVNHQFSKSFAFEQLFDRWVKRYIADDLSVFSILRADKELAIAKTFAHLTDFHLKFASCNRNFHIDPKMRGVTRWCNQCPKCQFVYLMLAVWLTPDAMKTIFGDNLLADEQAIEGFKALLALDGQKPFECVGEAEEARAAVVALSRCELWRDHRVIQVLITDIDLDEVPSLDAMLAPTGPHLIPQDLQP